MSSGVTNHTVEGEDRVLPSHARRQDDACQRFEAEWLGGQRPRIDEFLQHVPKDERMDLLTELVLLEMDLRQQDGEAPDLQDYRSRYPELTGRIGASVGKAAGRPGASATTVEATRGSHFPIGPDGGRSGSRFRIVRLHAEGGLGSVYVARDEELRREVAVKTIKEPYAHDAVSRERFLLEGEITGLLEHPGIVPVYSMGRDDGDRPYYAMRLIKGKTLKEAIRHFHQDSGAPGHGERWHSLELRELLGRFVAVCNTVAYAHSRGVIHRDLKPDNVLLGPYGETLVADWGLAKVVGRADPRGPAGPAPADDAPEPTLRPEAAGTDPTRGPLGTPQYMSPEQARVDADQIGPASDIYTEVREYFST